MFCVYVTFYFGDLLPSFYIGSSSVSRVSNGYRGTVKSKKYGRIWREELLHNPNLFLTVIVSTFETRREATEAELQLQIDHQVVQSPEFINESYATVNGFFTMEKSGQKNPMFGRKHSSKTITILSEKAKARNQCGEKNPMFGKPGPKSMLGKKHTEEARDKMRLKQQARILENNHWQGVKGENHPAFGFKHSQEFIASQKTPKPKITCPHCNKSGGKPVMTRFHFARCPLLR